MKQMTDYIGERDEPETKPPENRVILGTDPIPGVDFIDLFKKDNPKFILISASTPWKSTYHRVTREPLENKCPLCEIGIPLKKKK